MRSSISVLLFVALALLTACRQSDAPRENPSETAAATTEVPTVAQRELSPKELLVGTWKMKVAVNNDRLERYLARGGTLKIRRNREELLDELKRIVASEVTMEFRIDGTLIRTMKGEGDKSQVSRGDWKVLDEEKARLTIEIGYNSSKGLDKLRLVQKPQLVFQDKDRFTMEEPDHQGMPLTLPLWERIAAGSLEYTGNGENGVPPPFRKEPHPKDPDVVAMLTEHRGKASLDASGDIVGLSFDADIDLGQCSVPRGALPSLSRITTLRSLDLSERQITDDDMRHVAMLSTLTDLDIGYNTIGDAGLRNLEGLANLKSLRLSHTSITDQGLASLSGLIGLEWLDISDTRVGDPGMAALRDLRNLRRFEAGKTKISGAGLKHLSDMSRMEVLNLRGTTVDDDGTANLKGMSKLTHLDLEETKVTDAGIKHLAALSKISVVSLSGTAVGDASIEILVQRNDLTELNLNKTRVTDAGLRLLKGTKSLKRLYVGGTEVTPSGLQDFKSAQPGCTVFDWGKAAIPRGR